MFRLSAGIKCFSDRSVCDEKTEVCWLETYLNSPSRSCISDPFLVHFSLKGKAVLNATGGLKDKCVKMKNSGAIGTSVK